MHHFARWASLWVPFRAGRWFSIPALALMICLPLLATVSGCCPKQDSATCPRVVVPPPQPQPPRLRVQAGNARAWPYSCEKGLAIARRQLAAHLRLKELLTWYSQTQGEKSMQETLFVGREQLFSRRSLAFIQECLAKISDPVARRAAEYLRDYLAMAYIERKVAPLSDTITAAELRATVRLPWLAQRGPIPLRQLPVLLSTERNPRRRAQISAAINKVFRTVLNPLLEKRWIRAHELAQWMGYKSYADLSVKAKRVDLAQLVKLGAAFMKTSEPLFKRLMADVAKENLGVTLKQVRRSDHDRLVRAPKVERHLPQALMIPAFRYFLKGIGLDMTTVAKSRIVIDASLHAKKRPRAAMFPMLVPSDIRISVKPTGGLDSWVTLFHEGGHGLHYSWTTTKRFEFQYLGSYSITEAFAELFARAWEEPAWLRRYQRFVREVNMGRHRNLLPKGVRPPRAPLLTNRLMGYLIRTRLAYTLYLARRYGWAKLIYESVLHSAPQAVYQGIYQGQTSDRRALYKALFERAYGYPLTSHDADRYLIDVDSFFYAADYARAFMLADLLHEHLRTKFGKDWFANPRVGRYLKGLWAEGNRYTAEEIAQKLGTTLDFRATQARLERLFVASEKLSGRKVPRRVVGGPPPRRGAAKPCRPSPRRPGKCKVSY